MIPRRLRPASPPVEFERRVFPVVGRERLAGIAWHRLHRREFPARFHASSGSRLTPASLAFPCSYFGASEETAVAEVWGDAIDARREAGGRVFSITAERAAAYLFLKLQTPLPVLRLCDLTDAATRAGVGVDSATLYAPDLRLPQAWAECMARHPARLDGIVYRSRHTDEPCLVVWKRPGRRSAVEGLRFIEAGPFADSEAARRLAHRMGMRLAFVR